MSKVKNAWERIESWLTAHAPIVAEALPAPASLDSITGVEAMIGHRFPDDLRESYLVRNGLDYGEVEVNIFPTPPDSWDDMAFCLLPIEQVAAEWKIWKDLIDGGDFEGMESEPAIGISDAWWDDGWVPVAGNGGGDFICVDLKPTTGGTAGQVICAWHDSEERQLLASSWANYLDSLADELDGGQLKYDEDCGVIRIDEE